MPGASKGERVVAGNAGREVCREVAMIPGFGEVKMPWLFHRFSGRLEPSREQLLEELDQVVATGNYRRFLAEADPSRLARLVAHATSGCTLPVEDNEPTAVGSEAAVLLPVADALLGSVSARWWSSPCAAEDQHLVDVRPSPRYPSPPDLAPSAALAAGVEEEAAAERSLRNDDSVSFPPPANHGHPSWLAWSVPTSPWVTTRSVAGQYPLPALGLIWDWNREGEYHSRQWRAGVADDARVYEIDNPEAWRSLVERYPREVPYSRRSIWWRGSRWEGTWLLPDWTAVAADFDGVHLTVTGFLKTTGTILAIGGARATLVYWQPDETYWLNDVISLDPSPTIWPDEKQRLPRDDYADLVFGDDGSLSLDRR